MKNMVIILIILASLTFCSKSKVQEPRVKKANNLIKEFKMLKGQKKFREAKTKLDSANKIKQKLQKEGKKNIPYLVWKKLTYEIKWAYEDLDLYRKLYGTVPDSLVERITEKYGINKNYHKDGEIQSYGDETNGLYFSKVDDGIGYLTMDFTYVEEGEDPLSYVKDIEVYANGKMFVRHHRFYKISNRWHQATDIGEDRELILNIGHDDEILIKFCGLDSNTEYHDVWAKIDTNIYKAYKEIKNKYW